MTKYFRIDIDDGNRLAGIRRFLAILMKQAGIDAMLVPARLAVKNRIMPTLVSGSARLNESDPLSPAFAVNAAQQLARLTHRPAGGRLAAVLRPCEIRAFHELVKLNQGQRDPLLMIGLDCPGALSNSAFRSFADQYESMDAATQAFCAAALSDDPGRAVPEIASACRACDHPVPEGADIAIELFGADPAKGLTVRARTMAGETALTGFARPAAEPAPSQRNATLSAIVDERRTYRQQIFAKVEDATGSIGELSTYLADCVSCYNCRAACPVCYCTTCVFTTDTFRHEPFQYLQWARRKGGLKMPADTLFFHLTRMAHMSTACVGCGQCSNACPNDIPLSDLFSFIASHTQRAFAYAAGLDLSQRPPLCGFETEEYSEVVGLD